MIKNLVIVREKNQGEKDKHIRVKESETGKALQIDCGDRREN